MQDSLLKQCSICKQLLSISAFYAKQSACKECCKQRQRLYNQKHRDYINQRQKQYNDKNKEHYKQYREQNKESLNSKSRQYYVQNTDKILQQKASKKKEKAEYDKKYYYTVRRPIRPNYKYLTASQRYYENQLGNCLSSGMRHALKGNKAGRHWEDLVPYNLQKLKEHLEKQFTPNMSWSNYGTYWEIDHIIPQCQFGKDSKSFQICWSLANLRPLEKSLNRQRPKDGSDISEELKNKILNQNILLEEI